MVDVRIDDSDLRRGIAQLVRGLDDQADRVGMDQARATAAAIRARVPVRSGRLRSTVGAVPIGDGGATTYGGTLPYARYIERRAHAVDAALVGAPDRFYRAMRAGAEAEVRRL